MLSLLLQLQCGGFPLSIFQIFLLTLLRLGFFDSVYDDWGWLFFGRGHKTGLVYAKNLKFGVEVAPNKRTIRKSY